MMQSDLLREKLRALYGDGSKHSVYQNVPEFVRQALGYSEKIDEGWRSDTPRYRYLLERISLNQGSVIADIGANTGYFSLNLARDRPQCQVRAYEPNPNHRLFIQEIAEAFELKNISTSREIWNAHYLTQLEPFDTVLLLNILHHAGFDFDRKLPDENGAFEKYAVDYLQQLRTRTKYLCFQIGSNRGGDKQRPLFSYDDDIRRLEWSCGILTAAGWAIQHIGIAGHTAGGQVHYEDMPAQLVAKARAGEVRNTAFTDYFSAMNLARFPGEFYRRPLFICEAANSTFLPISGSR